MVSIISYCKWRKGEGGTGVTNPPHSCRSLCETASPPPLQKKPPLIISGFIFLFLQASTCSAQQLFYTFLPDLSADKHMLCSSQYNLK